MKKRFILIYIILLCQVCFSSPVDSKVEKIDSLLNLYADEDLFSGVVLVAIKGNIVYKKAFGLANREWKIPMTTDTKFRIGSVSKPFTALLILQLVQDGYLSLDETIDNFLPDYTGPGKSTITISQLLTHTAGIRSSIPEEEEQIRERQFHRLEDLKHYAETAALYFEPGTGFRYSNLGYSLLALIAQRIMHQPFEQLLQARIFDPLHLSDTKNDLDIFIEDRLAVGYEYDLLNGYTNTTFLDNSYASGAGGITSTVDDLYQWCLALQKNNKLLSEELKNEMYRPSARGPYGYGWFIRERALNNVADTLKIIEHSGSINGY